MWHMPHINQIAACRDMNTYFVHVVFCSGYEKIAHLLLLVLKGLWCAVVSLNTQAYIYFSTTTLGM